MPQDKKYAGEDTRLEIGDRNTIREFCTFNLGRSQDAGRHPHRQRQLDHGLRHIAHDCQVGNHTTFANNAQLAGHVHIDDWAILGGYTGAYQFCRIGAHVMTAVGTVVLQDIPPYLMAAGNTAQPYGINTEGLKRRGFSSEAITALKRAYRTLYKSGLMLEEARAKLIEEAQIQPDVRLLVDFLTFRNAASFDEGKGQRSPHRPGGGRGHGTCWPAI